jgi:hypothetical protein
MDTTITRITVQATLVILLTILDLTMAQQTGKAMLEVTPTIFGLDTTGHNTLVDPTTTARQANISAHPTQALIMLGALEAQED